MACRKHHASHRGLTAIPDGETKHRRGTGPSSVHLPLTGTLTPCPGQTTETGRGRGAENSQRPTVGGRIRRAIARGRYQATALGARADTSEPPKGAI